MANKWTRDRIIREILRREAAGLPLNLGGSQRVEHSLYNAGRRIFGSWRHAVQAAGISPLTALPGEKWTPARITLVIRMLARRKRPLSLARIEQRYDHLVSAARRAYGSWAKAVVAAGVNPARLRRVVPWTRERVIEAILQRALSSNHLLVARSIEPRSLVDAGRRFFGSWGAALEVAGLDLKSDAVPSRADMTNVLAEEISSKPRPRWTREVIIEAVLTRLRQGERLNATYIYWQDRRLFRAAVRRFRSWGGALRAAGLDPAQHRRNRETGRPAETGQHREEPPLQSQPSSALRPAEPS